MLAKLLKVRPLAHQDDGVARREEFIPGRGKLQAAVRSLDGDDNPPAPLMSASRRLLPAGRSSRDQQLIHLDLDARSIRDQFRKLDSRRIGQQRNDPVRSDRRGHDNVVGTRLPSFLGVLAPSARETMTR